ncbi:MAG: 1-acyl-sn-glycerol-3-phosphate acyltransferase [Lachnospiraceae bacterium]|nr:1-acyl-sn-glycerol-3-phosphate acyltransferase [Lachnospiraceae bacterium]
MIRLLLVALFLITFLILSIPIFFIEWLIGKKNPALRDISSLRIVQWAFKVILWLSGCRLTVIGEENVPKDEAVLYIGNHRGFFDIVATYARCPRLTGYMAKKEIERVPLLSVWMRLLHCLFLDRDDIRQGLKTILTGIEHIKNGISVCVFPEGTRSTGSDQTELLPFREGAFKIATKTDCPIIPFALTNTSAIFEDHFPFIRGTRVTLEYGKPFRPSELDKADKKTIGAYTRNIIIEMVKKNAAG